MFNINTVRTNVVYPSVFRVLGWGISCVMVGSMGLGCSRSIDSSLSSPNPSTPTLSTTPATSKDVTQDANGSGVLILTANGEDFVRQGLVSNDGWAIAFDHVYLTFANVIAYQTTPAYDPKISHEITHSIQKVTVQDQPITIDLAAGDAEAAPIVVSTISAPAGHYNALSWNLVPDPAGGSDGYSVHLLGTAQKADQTIQFSIGLDGSYYYSCGEYIGDTRKGILQNGQSSSLEMTLHFDHIFGDGSQEEGKSGDKEKAAPLGFDPLAVLAQDNVLDVDFASLETRLDPNHLAQLYDAMRGLGHVGEGHCAVL